MQFLGVAIVRPPGHHAEADEACGFCLFNNMAVGAKYALEMQSMKRILILDWDVHHGNGIQVKFVFCKKATKIDKIFTIDLTFSI